MKNKRIIIMMACFLLAYGTLFPCTMFKINKNGKVWVGNNEDFIGPLTKIWYTPAEKGKYGCVFFGFGNMFAQGGMNDQGLIFDGFATAPLKVKNTKGLRLDLGGLIEKMMYECATVDEAVKLLKRYNLHDLERAQLMVVDKTGESMIVEGDVFHRNKEEFQVVTNFYLSQLQKGDPFPCRRYRAATAILKEKDSSLETCRAVLSTCSGEGRRVATVYSNIYDPKQKQVYLYYFHNFEEVVVLDLEKELKKGKRTIDLPSLFKGSSAAERFVEQFKKTKKQKIEKRGRGEQGKR